MNTIWEDFKGTPISAERKWVRVVMLPLVAVVSILPLLLAGIMDAVKAWGGLLKDIYKGYVSDTKLRKSGQ